MFDNKAQSALEYLMTYGWALIVIAIVIGVLIFVTGSATGGVTCQSQSTNMVLKESSVSAANGVGITLMNATGGDITAIAASSTAFGGTAVIKTGSPLVVGTAAVKNTTFTVTGLTVAAGNLSNGKIDVNYTTAGGLPATAVINCSGTVA
ncbi:MAG: hypothetical protein WCW44_00815 [archaeon]|jgi:hypothetical protein